MSTNDIDKLLDKFFDAETTLEEEKTLKSYFESGCETKHEKFKAYFEFAHKESLIVYTERKQKPILMNKYFKYASVAALILISATLVFIYNANQKSKEQLRTTENAIRFVCFQVNQAQEEMEPMRLVNSSFKELEKLNELEKTQDILLKQLRIIQNATTN